MRRYLVAGNWKMHGDRRRVAALTGALKERVSADSGAEMAIIPPFVYLSQVAVMSAQSGIQLGAQNLCEQEDEGAFTGEISAAMLSDVGCHYVVVGHSERRQLYAESDEVIARKVRAALQAGLTPILCVGESSVEREADQTLAVVERQLAAVLDAVGERAFAGSVVAYEPVWAIGTGVTASPEQAQQVHEYLRELLTARDAGLAARTRLLYGGSVKADNAAELFGQPDIDGGLVGGASLDAEEFTAIYQAAR